MLITDVEKLMKLNNYHLATNIAIIDPSKDHQSMGTRTSGWILDGHDIKNKLFLIVVRSSIPAAHALSRTACTTP